jgi:hypothetical protein
LVNEKIEGLYKDIKKQDPLFSKINKNAAVETNAMVVTLLHGHQSKDVFYKMP